MLDLGHKKLDVWKLGIKFVKDIYQLTLKTYNAQITGKFERSEIRHMIQILDNAII